MTYILYIYIYKAMRLRITQHGVSCNECNHQGFNLTRNQCSSTTSYPSFLTQIVYIYIYVYCVYVTGIVYMLQVLCICSYTCSYTWWGLYFVPISFILVDNTPYSRQYTLQYTIHLTVDNTPYSIQYTLQ